MNDRRHFQPQERGNSGLHMRVDARDLAQMTIGSMALAVPVAMAEEAWTLSEELPAMNTIGIFVVSILVVSLFIHQVYHARHGVEPAPPAPVPLVSPRDEIVPLSNIRKRTAEHMVMSKQASPHVLTAMEVDYERVEQVRSRHKAGWKADEGFSLTYLPFIARAVADALRDFPHLNASFGGDHLVVHDQINLAVAVDIDFEGLLAPVVKGVDGKRLRQIARDIKDVADRTRTKQLTPDDLSGGTFTLTNAGQYGTMMQFPIINQPQVAILSTDGVKRKPVVVTDEFGNESIAIHSVGVLALAWDHRAFDGAYAAAFLHRIQEIIEQRDWEAEIR